MSVSQLQAWMLRGGAFYYDQSGMLHLTLARRPLDYIRVALNSLRKSSYPISSGFDSCIQPIFIIGSGRSGNTLMRRVLNNHQGVFIPAETYVLGRTFATYIQKSTMNWSKLVNAVVGQFSMHPEFHTIGLTDFRPFINTALNLPRERRSLAKLLDCFYRQLAEAANRHSVKRWGDKTPVNVFHLKRLQQIFPNAQYVYMIRDGFDATFSYVSAGLYKSLDHAASRWVASNRLATRFVANESSAIKVYYEDLVGNPVSTLNTICDFLDLEYDHHMLSSNVKWPLGDVEVHNHHYEASQELTGEFVGKGRRALGRHEKKRIWQIIGREMRIQGYEF